MISKASRVKENICIPLYRVYIIKINSNECIYIYILQYVSS